MLKNSITVFNTDNNNTFYLIVTLKTGELAAENVALSLQECFCVCVGVYTGHGQILQVHLFFTQMYHSFQKVKPIYYIDA